MTRRTWERSCRARAAQELGPALEKQQFAVPSSVPGADFDCLLFLAYRSAGTPLEACQFPAEQRFAAV